MFIWLGLKKYVATYLNFSLSNIINPFPNVATIYVQQNIRGENFCNFCSFVLSHECFMTNKFMIKVAVPHEELFHKHSFSISITKFPPNV